MLNDPIVTAYGFTVTSAGGTPTNLRRIAIGKYTAVDGPFSADQPVRFNIKSQPRTVGNSSYGALMEMDKNVAPVNGVQQSDDTLTVSINMKGNNRSFSSADYKNALALAFWQLHGNFDRIISGES